MSTLADRGISPAARLDYSQLSQLILPVGTVFGPNSIAGAALAHGDYVDLASAQPSIGGAKTFNVGTTFSGGLTAPSGTVSNFGSIKALNAGGINPQWFNVCDYGALGDGVTDDAAAINAAIAAASAVGRGFVYVPRGAVANYILGAPLVMNPNISFTMAPNTVFSAKSGYAGNAVNFSAGNYSGGSKFRFTEILNFSSGIGLSFLDGSSFADVSIVSIYGCNTGIGVTASPTGVFGHVVRFLLISGCVYGILCTLNTNASQIQGVYFGGPQAYVNGAVNAIYIQQIGAISGANVTMSSNTFEVNLNGNAANTAGIVFSNISLLSPNLFRAPSSFGSLQAGRYIWAINGAAVSGQVFELSLYETASGAYNDFNAFQTGGQQPANVLRILGGSGLIAGQLAPGYFNATTTTNTRASFNGGTPIFFKRIIVACTLPTMATGTFANFYAYSPFVSGVQYQVKATTSAATGAVLIAGCQDEHLIAGIDGNASANQILIRVLAVAAVTAGQLFFVGLEFLD